MTQAASLSFYTLLSLAPLLVLLLWLTASLYPPAQQSLVDQIGALAGEQAAVVAETIIRNADSQPDVGSLAGLASTGLLFVGATVVFAQLQGALNLIFRTGGEKLGGLGAWLRKRVFSLGVVLALGFLLIVSMIATTALQLVFARLPRPRQRKRKRRRGSPRWSGTWRRSTRPCPAISACTCTAWGPRPRPASWTWAKAVPGTCPRPSRCRWRSRCWRRWMPANWPWTRNWN